jgi:protein ImuB
MLWLCLQFPFLPLDVFLQEDGAAVAVDRQQVVSANAAAIRAGVRQGLGLSGVLGLVPGIRVHERQPEREAELLRTLACWAEGFTPTVCIASADELLLEIGGCLRLFGGLEALRGMVRAGLEEQGFEALQGIAPTPLAAQWLARAGDEEACEDSAFLRQRLGHLAVEVMGFMNAKDMKTLAALGAQALGDLLALPATGLRRRFGAELPLRLAQALGEVPDLREAFVFPERFAQSLELPAKVEHAGMLLFAARRLLAALCGWLGARAAGVVECNLLLEHEDGMPPSVMTLALAEASADLQRLERVLRERLEHFRLEAPVWRIQLRVESPQTLSGRSLGLFGQEAALALAPVIERLRARLGKDAVQALSLVEDHRPECASAYVSRDQAAGQQAGKNAGKKAVAGRKSRPLWLLPKPKLLPECNGVPQRGGDLLRLAGPERIESGWWGQDEDATGDVRRDYYVACTARHEWLWIFRDADGWWLHGFFA